MNSILKFVVLGRSWVSSPGGTSIAYRAMRMPPAAAFYRASGFVLWRKREVSRRPSHRPEDSVREHSLIAAVLPDRRLMAQRRVEYSSLAVKSFPGERPTIESLMHTGLAKVHRAWVESQQHV